MAMKKKNRGFALAHFNIVFHPEPEGGFTVTVPSLPGCVTFGKTLAQAKEMAADAIELYLKDVAARGDSLPMSTDEYIGNVAVALPAKLLTHA